MNHINAATLRSWITDGAELALFDAREEGEFCASHLFLAQPVAIKILLPEFALAMNCRNAQPIHALIQRFAGEGLSANALRHDGRRPELIEVDGPRSTIRALQAVLHRLRVDEGVKPWDIAVLTGGRLEGDKGAQLWADAAEQAAVGLEPPADLHGSAAYRRQLARVLAGRSMIEAYDRAKGSR